MAGCHFRLPSRAIGWAALLVLFGSTGAGRALADGVPSPDVSQAWQNARRLEAQGHLDTAIELLKRARNLAPDDERLAVALTWAYLKQPNQFWALRTATRYRDEHPNACAARAVTVWIELEMANLEQAEELVAEPGCDRSPEDRARFSLLRTFLAEHRRDARAASRYLGDAPRGRLYAEDVPLLNSLLSKYDPGRLPLLSSKLEMAAGYTNNGLAGSPTDATTPPGDRGSALVVVDAKLRAVVPAARYLRPVLAGQLRFFEMLQGPMRDLSYEEPTLHAGLLLGPEPPRLLVSYAFDAVRLHGGDRYDEGPWWYSEAHRAEWEFEVSHDIMAWGGLGARRFREMARTRFEMEQGLGRAWAPHPSLRLLGAVSGRVQQANAVAYDLVGGTTLAELDWKLRPQLDLRWNLAASADWYPRSQGFFAAANGRARRDLLERSSFGLWLIMAPGWQIGSTYDLSHRMSTAQAYGFVDHRLLVRATWSFDTDQHTALGEAGRAVMQWPSSSEHQVEDNARIQQLLRQDEAVKRGSSCPK